MIHNHKRFMILTTLAVAILTPTVVAQHLTLRDAVEIALKNNERIRQYEERLKQKNYQNLEAWGNFLPSVTLTGSYNYMNDPLQIDLDPIRQAMITLQAGTQTKLADVYNRLAGGPGLTAPQQAAVLSGNTTSLQSAVPAFVETLKEQEFKSASFVGVQPLFLGGKLLAAKKFASTELESAEIELKKTKDEVAQEAITTYMAVVLLNDVLTTRRNVLEGMRHHDSNAQRLLKEGLLANHQALRAEVAVAEADRNLFDDENKRSLALIALRNILGLPEDEPLDISDSLVFHNAQDSLCMLLQQARVNHPMLQLIAQKKDAASQKFNSERAEFLPQIAAFGKYELYPHYLSALEPRWVVGVQVSLNIFNGGKKFARLESAAHLEREVDAIEAEATKKINILVTKNYTDMTNSRNRFFKLKSNLSLAHENLRLMSNRFQTGLGTSLDVIDAQLILEKNEIESKTSLFDYYKSMTELYTAAGNPQKVLELWNSKENKDEAH